ncbi:MAG: DUF167 domain-containing protein [Woeseiaceae bacterium]
MENPDVLVPVRVHARSSRNMIVGVVDGRLRIHSTAPPADDRANRNVAGQLAREFGVAPSHVTLLRGDRTRDKLFRIAAPGRLPGLSRTAVPAPCNLGRAMAMGYSRSVGRRGAGGLAR